MLEGGGSGIVRKPVSSSKRVADPPRRMKQASAHQTRRRINRGSGGGHGSGGRGYSGGGSYSSGRSSGGGGGGGGTYKAAKPKPPPSVNDYLGMDSGYQNAVRGNKRARQDFLSETGRRRGEANTQYLQTKSSMERDRQRQLDEIRQEFASRGLIQSGLFGEEQGEFQTKFAEQMNALSQQQAGLLADLLSQEKNYARESDLSLEQAKQEALARRAAKYKIGA